MLADFILLAALALAVLAFCRIAYPNPAPRGSDDDPILDEMRRRSLEERAREWEGRW